MNKNSKLQKPSSEKDLLSINKQQTLNVLNEKEQALIKGGYMSACLANDKKIRKKEHAMM